MDPRSLLGALASVLAMSLAGSLLAGCPYPFPLESESGDQDAGANSPPVIVRVDAPYQPPGPIILDTEAIGLGVPPEPMTVVVSDIDRDDQVFVYFYVDYGNPGPTPARNECSGSAGSVNRTLSCQIDRLCQDIEPPATGLLLEAMVVDRVPNLSGDPLFRALPEGTGRSFQSWLLQCE